jgi:hypothetical protein
MGQCSLSGCQSLSWCVHSLAVQLCGVCLYPLFELYQSHDTTSVLLKNSLDLTIDKLGRIEFEIKLNKFRAARTIIQTKCKDVVFPCSSGGVKINSNKTDCLWQDSGCGFNCLDQVATELSLW